MFTIWTRAEQQKLLISPQKLLLTYHRRSIYRKFFTHSINKQNQDFIEVAPKLRLYAPDNIFNQYQSLTFWGEFAYTSPQKPRLSEECKRAYDLQITLLARRMQDDLDYRKYNQVLDTIQCPDCGTTHDIVGKCPTCGMTYERMQIRAEEILKWTQKSNAFENDKNEKN